MAYSQLQYQLPSEILQSVVASIIVQCLHCLKHVARFLDMPNAYFTVGCEIWYLLKHRLDQTTQTIYTQYIYGPPSVFWQKFCEIGTELQSMHWTQTSHSPFYLS